ncbi:MAG: hypothetical protein J6U64_03845, partial [Alphaproteobacteria bacterium]|nr:hypothetical protein [Alphaproteobacteria bacterium]
GAESETETWTDTDGGWGITVGGLGGGLCGYSPCPLLDDETNTPKENATVVEFRTLFPGEEFTYDRCMDYLTGMDEGRYPKYVCECNEGYTEVRPSDGTEVCCPSKYACGTSILGACCSEETPECVTSVKMALCCAEGKGCGDSLGNIFCCGENEICEEDECKKCPEDKPVACASWCCEEGSVCGENEGECCSSDGKTCCSSSQVVAQVQGSKETIYACCNYRPKYIDDPDGEKIAERAYMANWGEIICTPNEIDCEEYDGEMSCDENCSGENEPTYNGCCPYDNTTYCYGPDSIACCKYGAGDECGCRAENAEPCAKGEDWATYCATDYTCVKDEGVEPYCSYNGDEE